MSCRVSKRDRATLAAEYAPTKTELDTRAKAIDAKRVEAMAESKGVEGTLKVGKGPVYRQRVGDLGKLQDDFKIQDDRVKDAKKRLDTAESAHLADRARAGAIDGELAKYKGEEQTAGQRIRMAQENVAGQDAEQRVDPGRVLPAFETARAEFRQHPDASASPRCSSSARSFTVPCSQPTSTKPKVAGHRLRSQAGDRGGRQPVHAECRHQGVQRQLRRRRQARPAQRRPTACSALPANAWPTAACRAWRRTSCAPRSASRR